MSLVAAAPRTSRTRRALWGVMLLLSTAIVLVSSAYVLAYPSITFEVQRAVYLAHRGPLFLHIAGASVALLTAGWQLSGTIRRRWPRVHRVTGRIYLVGVLIGGIGALLLAPLSYGGPVAHAGFAVLAVTWLTVSALGLAAIRNGDVGRHRRWMTRSFALTFAVTLRLEIPVYFGLHALGIAPFGFPVAYAGIAWLAWVPNLAIGWWLTRAAPGRHLPAPADTVTG